MSPVCLVFHTEGKVIMCVCKINQVFFILTTREPSVNRKDLPALTLAKPPRLFQGSGPPSLYYTFSTDDISKGAFINDVTQI